MGRFFLRVCVMNSAVQQRISLDVTKVTLPSPVTQQLNTVQGQIEYADSTFPKRTSRAVAGMGVRGMQDQITSFNTLQPTVVRTIREVFDEAVKELEARQGLGTLSQEIQAKVARQIVDLAKHGVCNRERLRSAALDALPL